MSFQLIDHKRKLNESEEEYIYRICDLRDIIGTWNDVADILNKELNYEFTESRYRKQYQAFQKMFNANKNKFIEDDNYLKEVQIKNDEFFKMKKQFEDQRREYNKLLTSDARSDHLTKNLIEIADRMNEDFPILFNKSVSYDDNGEAVLAISDIHYGMVTDNIWNTYNVEIAKDRMKFLVAKAIKCLKLHNPKVLHILLLGDLCHGAIHNSCRVASEEQTNKQLMHVSELIAEAVGAISEAGCVNEIMVYSTYGNHMRTIQNKNDSIHSDNMETIIPWWLKQRFKNEDNINVIDSDYYEFIKLNVCGYNICATHGDLDKFKNLGLTVNTIFTKKYGETIDYTLSGDKHHLEEFEQFDIESILIRSFCGTDDYSNEHRLYSSAGQTLIFFNNECGRDCTYNIKFKNR